MMAQLLSKETCWSDYPKISFQLLKCVGEKIKTYPHVKYVKVPFNLRKRFLLRRNVKALEVQHMALRGR